LKRRELEAEFKIAIGTAADLEGLASWRTQSFSRFDQDSFRSTQPAAQQPWLETTAAFAATVTKGARQRQPQLSLRPDRQPGAGHSLPFLVGLASPSRQAVVCLLLDGCRARARPRLEGVVGQFKGRFDQGWDVYRQETFGRQEKLGVITQDAVLTGRPDAFPAVRG
jgi:hypothetical protein